MSGLPDLPDFLPLMKDWTDAVNGSSQSTNREGHELQDTCKTNSSTVDMSSPKAQRKTRSCISYMHKCVRAQKSFFLLDTQGKLYEMIAGDISLNSLITSVPRKGQSDEFKILSSPQPLMNQSHEPQFQKKKQIVSETSSWQGLILIRVFQMALHLVYCHSVKARGVHQSRKGTPNKRNPAERRKQIKPRKP